MEAPIPLTPQGYGKDQNVINLLNFELKKNDISYNCDLNTVGNNKIEFIISDKNNKFNKYCNQFCLQDFINMNKYFKMFESLKELYEDLIGIIKENKIEIESCNNDIIILKINVMTRNNNIITIHLKKSELNENDKYNFILDEIPQLKKENESKDLKINALELKIKELEKKNSELKNYIDEKLMNYIDEKLKVTQNPSKILNYNSKIFNDISEIEFILTNIKGKSLSLLYSSTIEGENEEKFKSCYIDKNDILVLIKTNENKRFGGYAHESFLLKEFEKSDPKAFLFNLDKKKIYESKNGIMSIWRGSDYFNSMNFGTGTDLRIFHKFFSNECYTRQMSCDYNYHNEDYALNGKLYFKVLILELYKVNF